MKIACIDCSTIPSITANSMQIMKTCNALAQLHNDVCLWVPGRVSVSWQELVVHYGLREQFDIYWIPSFRWCKQYDFVFKALGRACAWKTNVVYTRMLQVAVMACREICRLFSRCTICQAVPSDRTCFVIL